MKSREFQKNDQKSRFNFSKNRRLQASIKAFATTSKRDYGKVQCQNIGLMRVLSTLKEQTFLKNKLDIVDAAIIHEIENNLLFKPMKNFPLKSLKQHSSMKPISSIFTKKHLRLYTILQDCIARSI